jgi:hypothetical protein
MQGLLGNSMDDPRTMAVLQGVMGLLGARGNVQGVAQGLLGYQGAMQQAKQQAAQEDERATRRQMAEMQLRQAQQEQARRVAVEQAYRGALRSPEQMAMAAHGGPTNAAAQAAPGMAPGFDQNALIRGLTQADPMAAAQLLQPKPADYKVVGDALLQVGPGGVKEAYRAPAKPEAMPSAVREYEYARQQGYQGTFQQFKLEQQRAGASSTSVSYGTPVAAVDAQGNPVFIQPAKDGGAPAIIPGMRPPKSAAEERAEQEKAGRERQGKQMLSALTDAENILKGGRATASGIGNVVDAGARVVGVSTPGAQDAARLESLSGWLVSNVPRMEGPQSNYDVQNYMTMAGKVGDRTTPIPERMAALQEVRRLQQKYASINGTPMRQQPQEKQVVRTGTSNGRKVVQYSDGSIEYAD